MKAEKKYEKEIFGEIRPEENLSNIKSYLSFRKKSHGLGGYYMKKGLVYGLSVAGVVVIAGGITAGLLLNKNAKSKYDAAGKDSIVTMEVNPSISFSVDKNNIVTAVSGENNEGKMIVMDEKIKGLPLEEAIEKVIEIENETGYLVSGCVEMDENNIKFTVNVDDAKAKELLGNLIEKTVSSVSEKLDLDTKLKMLDGYTHDTLVAHIIELDPSYLEEDLKDKSYDELLDIMDAIMLEREKLYSTEIEDFYSTIKEYEFNMAEEEWTKEVISNIGGLYGVVYSAAVTGIDAAISGLNIAVDTLTSLKYNLFIAEDSVYQKTMDSFLNAKGYVLETKNKVANIENEELKNAATAELEKGLEALSQVETNLESAKESAIAQIDSGIQSINDAIENINGIIDDLPGQDVIEKALADKAAEHDKYMNEKKSELLETFEKEYKDDLLRAKDQYSNFRSELKSKIKEARA